MVADWMAGEPNNWATIEHCVGLQHEWNDLSCDLSLITMCESDTVNLPSGNPLLKILTYLKYTNKCSRVDEHSTRRDHPTDTVQLCLILEYLGCHSDAGDRDLPDIAAQNVNMTMPSCILRCYNRGTLQC